jgi:AcrR family transcriptional regulator
MALVDALAGSDGRALSARQIAKRAGVSVARFDECYDDLDECLDDAYRWVADEVHAAFADAFERPGDVHARLVDAIEQSLERLLADPGAMRLWFVEARRTTDPRLQASRAATRDRLVELVMQRDDGCAEEVPELHVEFLFGALAHAAHDELASGGDCAKAGRKVRKLLALLEPATG